jgi:hypothetical protein
MPTRRTFLATLAAAPSIGAAPSSDWISLFDGKSLRGWKPGESTTTWKVVDGCLAADGPRSHLFFTGEGPGIDFRNFEFETEVLTRPGANSGVFFHTKWQEKGFPEQGFEVQVCNTHVGEGNYRENKKTASLYGVRNVYKALVKDDEWFKLAFSVRANRVQVWLNGVQTVDYVEPDPPVLAADGRGRYLSHGIFALQGHDPGSKVMFRNIRVRPLEDSLPKEPAPVVDGIWRQILELSAANVPVVDYHGHLKSGLSIDELLRRSRQTGIFYGIAINCGKGFPVQDDETARAWLEENRKYPVYTAMQAEGREWVTMFKPETVAQFDYVFTDSMTWTDDNGRRMRTWMPNEVGPISDPQAFMEMLVKRAVGILEREPVDIYVNPTFIPDSIAARYDELWTEERMRKVIAAARKNEVALEINDRYKLPGKKFLRLAKEEGLKFTFGTNNGGANDLRRCDYGLEVTRELGLKWQDFFVPRKQGQKPVELRGLPKG